MGTVENFDSFSELDIAVIGMSGRFPGAKNIQELWQNLREGVESISFFSDKELESAGVDAATLRHPNYVKAAPVLDDVDLFDASFFGYSPKEAQMMDPQSRLFLECAWEALENAGYNATKYEGAIGVYACQSLSTYLLNNAYPKLNFFSSLLSSKNLQIVMATAREFLPTRVSYKLNLKGPSLNVQTACSSSLVAIHLARQSLLMGECNMALVGGVSIYLPQNTGYLYEEGMMLSPDGRCRAFDAQAQGTVFGRGLGVVLLKPLTDAIADRDCIQAVIKGTAINNDGSVKIGYTAPSVRGQAEVIAEAIANAGVEAGTIGYVEAHGTGTAQGDPIEIAGLTQAFSLSTQKKGFCAIGSVKPNIGHLDVAAGITGLIKTVLMLKHKLLVPTLHYEKPNPQIDFANSPFYVNTKLQRWQTNGTPRRAGVSAFGVGGTNAHAILEEAPELAAIEVQVERPLHILSLSAKSEQALKELAARYETHLASHPSQSIGDVCFTANVGRVHFDNRLSVVAESPAQMGDRLAAFVAGKTTEGVFSAHAGKSQPKIAFLFTGQGSQYVGMGRQLYETQLAFREAIDQCDELLRPYLEQPLLSVLYPEPSATSPIDETACAQPALFAIEYALAQLWRSWGVEPAAVMGHSLGEYVAACVAGVFSLEDALKLVAQRGRLMQALPPGGEMVAVFACEALVADAVRPYQSSVAIAALNGKAETVISGTGEAVQAVLEVLAAQGIQSRRLSVSHAFHSPLMEPMLDAFKSAAAQVTYSPPQIELISNLTGQVVTGEEIASPEYWCRHIRETVRFEESIKTLADAGIEVFVEIGPGCTLSAMGRRCWPTEAATWLPSLRKGRTDWQQMLASLGSLYIRGVEIDWAGFDQDYPRCRLPLPTYPFQRQRYWIETPSNKPVSQLQTQEQPVPDFSQVREEANVISQKPSLRDAVLAVNCNERQTWLVSYLSQQLTEVVGLSLSKADLQQSLRNLGLDSLMIAELKSQFEADLGISLPIVELLEGPSVVHIAEKLNRQLTLAQSVTEFSQSALASVLRLPKTDSAAWIVRYKPNPQARLRLFCFPYAGGGASIFRTWSDELPQWIEVCAIQLPGREERIREQPFTCLTSLVETLAQVLLPELDKPFAFYGHSMGALLSFELARYLCTHRGKSPVHLFVAACLAPQLPNPFRFISESSDLVLLELLHYFGTPMSILNNTEIMQALLPTIKADFQALSQYAGCKKELLKCPISAFGGGQDKIVSHDALAAWQERTNSNFNLQMFPGEHLFLESERPLLLSAISQGLRPYAMQMLNHQQPLDSLVAALSSRNLTEL